MIAVPSIADLYDTLEADLGNKLGLDDTGLKLALHAMAGVLSAQLKLIYLYVVDVERNVFPDEADPAADGGQLERLGLIWLKRLPFTATAGIYTASVTGITGSTLRAQLTFKSNDDSKSPGNLYILDNEYTLTGSGDVITLRSLNTGEDFLLDVNDNLTATEPIIGVNQQVTITGITTQPTDAEDIELYRQNVLDAMILEPQGGARADYRIWSADAAGVERVYPYTKNGDAGTVQVFVEATPADSTDGFGTAGSPLLTAVTNVIETDPDATLPTNDRGRRPLQAFLEVDSVTVIPVDVQITSLAVNTSDVQAMIIADLKTFLFGVRPYIAGCDLPRDKNDILTAVKVQSVVSDTIGNANSFLAFQLSVDGAVVNTYTFDGGEIPYLRNVTFV